MEQPAGHERWLDVPISTRAVTSGNNVDAYTDVDFPDGFSSGDVRAVATDGRFDHAAYERAVLLYKQVGLINVDPAALKLREILSNEIPDLVRERMRR